MSSLIDFGPMVAVARRIVPEADVWPVVDVTPNVVELTGIRPEDLVGGAVSWDELLHEADRSRVAERITEALAAGTDRFRHEEYRLVRPDGAVVWVCDETRVIRDASGNGTHLTAYLMDITDRKRAEMARRHREERLHAAIEGSRTGVWDWDAETNRVFFSRIWKEMLGYGPEDIADGIQEWDSRIHPEDRDAVYADLNRHLEGRTPFYENIHRLRCKGGEYKWILDRGRVVSRGRDGGPLRVIGTHTDMTAYKRIEGRLAEAETRYRALFDESPDGLVIIDPETALPVEFNDLACDQLGYDRETFAGLRITDYEALETPEQTHAHIERLMQSGRDDFDTLHRRRDGGLLPVRVTVKTIDLSDRTYFYATYRDISEQKRAEAALQTYSDRLALASRSGGIGVWEWDVVTGALVWDGRMREIYGVRADALSGTVADWRERVHPDDMERVEAALARAMTGAAPWEDGFRIIRPDGAERTVRAAALVQRDAGGEPVRLIGVNWDVTEQKMAEAALKRKSELLAATARAATRLLVDPDFDRVVREILPLVGDAVQADRTYLFENRFDSQGRGFTSQRFEWNSGAEAPQIDNPDLQNIPFDAIREFVDAVETSGRFQAIVRDLPDGPLKKMLQDQAIHTVLIVPIREGERFWGFVGFDDCRRERVWAEDEYLIIASFAANIGAAIHRGHIERDLTESERRYRGLVESQQDLVVRVDPEGRFTYVNDAYCRRFGRTRADLIGRTFQPLVHEDDIQPTLDAMKSLDVPPYRAYIEQRAHTRDGWRWLAWEDYAIKDDGGNTVEIQGVGRDITALKETQERLTEALAEADAARQRAEAANRAKSDFLATMSHEIRTPMNAVIGFTEILREWLHDQPEKRKLIQNIHDAGETLLSLINDILDLSKIEAGRMEVNEHPVDLHQQISDIVDIFSLQVREKGLDVTLDMADDLPDALLFDEVRLRQILFNLLGNAVKFTRKGGITLRTRHRPAGSDALDLTISVADTGIGIAPEDMATLFEPFRQAGDAAAAGRGTGLGLVISRRLTELMGGEITLESESGRGTTFTLHFPSVRRAAAPARTPDPALPLKARRFAPATVLVVDDMADNRALVKQYLAADPIRVLEAENGRECLESARRDPPDLILLDLRMPVMDGNETLARLKADDRLTPIPVVALTASVMKETRGEIRRRFDGYLSKPLRKETLLKTLAAYLPQASDAPPAPAYAPPTETAVHLLPSDLPAETRDALLDVLHAEIVPLVNRLVASIAFPDLDRLADRLADLGETHGVPDWRRMAGRIREHAEVFDIEQLDRLIGEMRKEMEA